MQEPIPRPVKNAFHVMEVSTQPIKDPASASTVLLASSPWVTLLHALIALQDRFKKMAALTPVIKSMLAVILSLEPPRRSCVRRERLHPLLASAHALHAEQVSLQAIQVLVSALNANLVRTVRPRDSLHVPRVHQALLLVLPLRLFAKSA
jgi:hypothetical protein